MGNGSRKLTGMGMGILVVGGRRILPAPERRVALRKRIKPGKKWDAIVAGDLFIDLVMTGFSSLPRLGEEGFAKACGREAGGGVANTACGLAALGRHAALFAVAGADEISWFRQRFAARGVDTSMLQVHPTDPTAITVAVSTPHDRIFYTYDGPNALLPGLLARPETREALGCARHVHFASPVAPPVLTELGQFLREHGTSTSIDVGWQEGWLKDPASVAALGSVDWFFPNELEGERMTGESDPQRMLAWFHEHCRAGVALKLGRNGSAATIDSECYFVPSIPVTPVDTTGAGDCFDAGFLYGVLCGMPVELCLRIGNICGALSTQAAGGIEGFPTLNKLRTYLGNDAGADSGSGG
jgi:sugar/nucleoside kinase (ribokinase family)